MFKKFPLLRIRPRFHLGLFAVACLVLVFVIYRISNDPALADHDAMVRLDKPTAGWILITKFFFQTMNNYGSSNDQTLSDDALQSARMGRMENSYDTSLPANVFGSQRIVHLDLKVRIEAKIYATRFCTLQFYWFLGCSSPSVVLCGVVSFAAEAGRYRSSNRVRGHVSIHWHPGWRASFQLLLSSWRSRNQQASRKKQIGSDSSYSNIWTPRVSIETKTT